MTDERFDDFLGLERRDFSAHRVVAFVGESGSGKSTAIGFLLEHHRDFLRAEVHVVDEARIVDLLRLWQPIARGSRVLLASHAPAWIVRAALPFPGVSVFETDRDAGKIARYLGRRGVAASKQAVTAYVRRFRATYTDVDLILERFPGRPFDAALARFERFCVLERAAQAGAPVRYRAIRT
jgi:hypothetical protein